MKRIFLIILMVILWSVPVSAMICLDNTDTLEGGASVDAVVDYTVFGLDVSTFANLAQGQLSDTDPSVLYTATAGTSIVSIVFVNTHTVPVTVNLYLDPANAGTPRRLIPKNLSLQSGYSMVFDGQRCTVIDANGGVVSGVNVSDTAYGAAWDATTTIAPSKNTIYDVLNGATTEILVGGGAGVAPVWTTATGTGAPVRAGSPTFTTQITTPKVLGGTATTQDLDFQTTSGVGGAGADMHFRVGSNGATEAVTILNSGKVGIGTTVPGAKLEVAGDVNITGNLNVTGVISAAFLNQAYGVTWDEDNSSPTLTRTGALAPFAAASSPGNGVLPIQAAMRRCVLSDAGVVQYYLCDTDSTKKEDCSTASVLDGTDGQVMVEIPKFYYKYSYNAATHVHSWSISGVAIPGYEPHPAFYKDGAWVDHRYIGVYEGSLYDDSAVAMCTDATAITNIYTAGDKLCSITAQCPKVNETRAEYRAAALSRGTGWRQQDFYLISAVQLLYLVEYASFYSQSVIGDGRTGLSGGTWVVDSYIGRTGKSNASGNATANTGGNTNDAYMSYRGIENFYGNVWKWVDGFNINNNIPYVCNVGTNFADDTASNYSQLLDTGGSGITLAASNNYQTTLEQTKGGFLPSAVGGGSSSTYITDYYYQDAAWRVARLGGTATYAATAGLFCWDLRDDSAGVAVNFGSRVCF